MRFRRSRNEIGPVVLAASFTEVSIGPYEAKIIFWEYYTSFRANPVKDETIGLIFKTPNRSGLFQGIPGRQAGTYHLAGRRPFLVYFSSAITWFEFKKAASEPPPAM